MDFTQFTGWFTSHDEGLADEGLADDEKTSRAAEATVPEPPRTVEAHDSFMFGSDGEPLGLDDVAHLFEAQPAEDVATNTSPIPAVNASAETPSGPTVPVWDGPHHPLLDKHRNSESGKFVAPTPPRHTLLLTSPAETPAAVSIPDRALQMTTGAPTPPLSTKVAMCNEVADNIACSSFDDVDCVATPTKAEIKPPATKPSSSQSKQQRADDFAQRKRDRALVLEAELYKQKLAGDQDAAMMLSIMELYFQQRTRSGRSEQHSFNFTISPTGPEGCRHLAPMYLYSLLNMRLSAGDSADITELWLDSTVITNLVRADAHNFPSDVHVCDPDDVFWILNGEVREVEALCKNIVTKVSKTGWPHNDNRYQLIPGIGQGITRIGVILNTGYHWVFGVIEPDLDSPIGQRVGTLSSVNSYDGKHNNKAGRMLEAFAGVLMCHADNQWEQDRWQHRDIPTIMQPNGWDCGPITIENCRRMMRRKAPVPDEASQHARREVCNGIRRKLLAELKDALFKACQEDFNKPSTSSLQTPIRSGSSSHQRSAARLSPVNTKLKNHAASERPTNTPEQAVVEANETSNDSFSFDYDDDPVFVPHQPQQVDPELLLTDAIYGRAERDKWLPETANVNYHLALLLDSQFGGRAGAPGHSQRVTMSGHIPMVDAPYFELRRRDALTLSSGQWLADPVIEAALRTYFPFDLHDGCSIARVQSINWLYNLPAHTTIDEAIDAQGLPFPLEHDTTVVYGVVVQNGQRGGSHYFAFRIDRVKMLVEILDSWLPHDPDDQVSHVTAIQNDMASMLNGLAASPLADSAWQSTAGNWTHFELVPTYKQRNSFDCGIHAIQNIVDYATRGTVKHHHNADILRQRCILRLQRFLDGTGDWQCKDPLDDEMHTAWRLARFQINTTHNVHEAPRNAKGIEQRSKLAQTLADIEGGAEEAPPEPDLASALSNEYTNSAASMSTRQVAVALLRAGPRDGMTWQELHKRYITFRIRMLLTVPRTYQRNLRNSLFSPRALVEETGGRLKLIDYDARHVWESRSAMTFFGRDMTDLYGPQAVVVDDIEARPKLVVSCSRASSTRNFDKAPIQDKSHLETLMEHASGLLKLWTLIFNGRADDLISIRSPDDMNADDCVWSLSYPMVRSSHCPAFSDNSGRSVEQDTTVYNVLQALEELAMEGNTRHLVQWVIAGVDGWTTDVQSIVDMVDKYEHLDHRLTIVMPQSKVMELPIVFQTRPVSTTTTRTQVSWAHFDLRMVATIWKALSIDVEAPVQWQQLGQTALIHMMRATEDWKTAITQTSSDTEAMRVAEDCFPLGRQLVSGVRRQHLGVPMDDEQVKTCIECESTTTSANWHRAHDNSGDVLCEDCFHLEPGPIADAKRKLKDSSITTRPSKRLRWTLDEKDQLHRLICVERKTTTDAAVQFVGRRSATAIRKAIYEGICKKADCDRGRECSVPPSKSREWSAEECELLLQLHKEGRSAAEIAQKLGDRTVNSVRAKRAQLQLSHLKIG